MSRFAVTAVALVALALQSGCGVKAPPRPPVTAGETAGTAAGDAAAAEPKDCPPTPAPTPAKETGGSR